MNNPIIPVKKVSLVFLLLGLSVVVASEKANAAAMDTENGPDIEAILAAAKKREDAGRINFCGFFVGMSRYDAQALAKHYRLEQGSYDFGNSPSVVSAAFTLKAVRRIVRRGNTFDELKRAVERQIGDMEFAPNIPNRAQIERAQSLLGDLGVAILEDETSDERYERKTIDGDIVRMGEKSGLIILNNEVAKSQNPVWESDWAKAKSNAAAAAAVEKERADKAKEEKLWTEKGAEAVSAMIENMLYVRGRGYLMAKYEVTQALWMAVMGENPSEYKGIDHPVENVSWNDCQIFLKKLNALDEVKKSNLSFRLPTDGEWFFACLGGAPLPNRRQRSLLSSGAFSSPASDESYSYCLLADGTKITKYSLNKVAWFWEAGEWPCKTHQPVGQKLSNAFGLYDMHGNVWEWTSTMHDDKAVACGGCWRSEAFNCESDDQEEFGTDYCSSNIGLRLAADDLNAIAKAKKAQEEQFRKMSADSNVRVATVKPVLDKMGIETVVVELPGGVQLLVNKLPNGEWFGAFEVTQAQWMSVMRRNPSSFKGGDHPVENVSWSDCQEFIEEVNALDAVRKMGFVFRLPTDDQWEYACRAGSKGDYCLDSEGKRIKKSTLGEVAWYGDNSDGKTHSVGQKKPNAFGLYDIHGNVCEWLSTPHSTGHVVSGGGWNDKEKVRGSCCFIPLSSSEPPCTVGGGFWSDSALSEIGFRIVANDPKTIAKAGLESNDRVAAVKPDLDKMGIETMVIEMPGGV